MNILVEHIGRILGYHDKKKEDKKNLGCIVSKIASIKLKFCFRKQKLC